MGGPTSISIEHLSVEFMIETSLSFKVTPRIQERITVPVTDRTTNGVLALARLVRDRSALYHQSSGVEKDKRQPTLLDIGRWTLMWTLDVLGLREGPLDATVANYRRQEYSARELMSDALRFIRMDRPT
jgi:hypothetical protein